MINIIVRDVCCPKCKSPELRPDGTLNIRGFKVCDDNGYWWSHCLVCAGYYSSEASDGYDPNKGWF